MAGSEIFASLNSKSVQYFAHQDQWVKRGVVLYIVPSCLLWQRLLGN